MLDYHPQQRNKNSLNSLKVNPIVNQCGTLQTNRFIMQSCTHAVSKISSFVQNETYSQDSIHKIAELFQYTFLREL